MNKITYHKISLNDSRKVLNICCKIWKQIIVFLFLRNPTGSRMYTSNPKPHLNACSPQRLGHYGLVLCPLHVINSVWFLAERDSTILFINSQGVCSIPTSYIRATVTCIWSTFRQREHGISLVDAGKIE